MCNTGILHETDIVKSVIRTRKRGTESRNGDPISKRLVKQSQRKFRASVRE